MPLFETKTPEEHARSSVERDAVPFVWSYAVEVVMRVSVLLVVSGKSKNKSCYFLPKEGGRKKHPNPATSSWSFLLVDEFHAHDEG